MPRSDLILASISFFAGVFWNSTLSAGIVLAGWVTLVYNALVIVAVVIALLIVTIKQWRMDSWRVANTLRFVFSQKDVWWNIAYLALTLCGPMMLLWSAKEDSVVLWPIAVAGALVIVLTSILAPPKLVVPTINE